MSHPSLFVLPCVLLLSAGARGQSVADVPIEESLKCVELTTPLPTSLEVLASKRITMPTNEAKSFTVVYQDPKTKDSIQVLTETGFDRSTNPSRVSAAKGYINGTNRTFTDNGYRLVKLEPEIRGPAFNELDFSADQSFVLHYSGPEDQPLYVRIKIFFTDKGFCVTSVSHDRERFSEINRAADGFRARK